MRHSYLLSMFTLPGCSLKKDRSVLESHFSEEQTQPEKLHRFIFSLTLKYQTSHPFLMILLWLRATMIAKNIFQAS